jgi:hypothetical protein
MRIPGALKIAVAVIAVVVVLGVLRNRPIENGPKSASSGIGDSPRASLAVGFLPVT